MANRLGRSFYRFSSVNRPPPPPGATSSQESAHSEGRRYPSQTRDQPPEPTSPKRHRSPPYSPPRQSLPPSPTYPATKVDSPKSFSPPRPAAESPKFKQTTRPTSPPEVERKIYKSVEKLTKSDGRHLDSGKTTHKQTNAIKVAGENLGAVMEIVHSPNKREGGHVMKKKSGHHVGNENDDVSKEKGGHKGKEASSLPSSTFMNSNFQSVNNSLLYNASLAHRDPGLHLCFSRKPSRDGAAIDDGKSLKN